MGFFDDNDPFEDIVSEFFGRRGRTRNYSSDFMEGEEDERTIDYVETKNHIYLIFELPGYDITDVNATIQGKELHIEAKRTPKEGDEPYIAQKLQTTKNITKTLPKIAKTKQFNKTFRNGILELRFEKK